MKQFAIILIFCSLAAAQKINFKRDLQNFSNLNTTAPLSGGGSIGSDRTILLTVCPNGDVYETSGGVWTCTVLSFASLSGTISLANTPLTTRGDVLTVNSVPALSRLGAGATNTYPKWNSLPDLVASSLPAAGTGSGAAHQFATSLNPDAAPTFAQPTLADINGGTAPASQTYNFNTDNITNAILTGSSNANSVTLLNLQISTGTLTGNSSDQTLWTYTLPANTLGAGKCLTVKAFFSSPSSTSTVFKIFFGSATTLNVTTGASSVILKADVNICNNPGVTNSQTWAVDSFTIGNLEFATTGTSAIDTTANQVVKMTFNNASPNTTLGALWKVSLDQ